MNSLLFLVVSFRLRSLQRVLSGSLGFDLNAFAAYQVRFRSVPKMACMSLRGRPCRTKPGHALNQKTL